MSEDETILGPDGALVQHSESKTQRSLERALEDRQYIPVIVKRTDEASRHPDDVLEKALLEGLEQIKRPAGSLFLSAVAAGLILAFAAMAVAFATVLHLQEMPYINGRLLRALVYPLGFIVCIMSGNQLFTEHTALAVYPTLARKNSILKMHWLWLIVFAGNILGTSIGSILLWLSEPVIGARLGYLEVAHELTRFNSSEIFISAILAGWLMAQGGWLVISSRPGIAQIVMIYIVTFLIGFGGLHHSIAGSAEIFTAALFSDKISISEIVRFLATAAIGNLVGGSVFVGILNYGHIRTTQ